MKFLIIAITIFISGSVYSQSDKSFTLSPTLNLNVVMKGLGQNDAGAGLGFRASVFSKKRLQLLIEANTDRFIGDKQLYVDTLTGKKAKNAIVYNLKVGTQFYATKRLALSVTYGPSWILVRDFSYNMHYGFKYGVNVHVDKLKRVQLGVSVVDIAREHGNVRYASLVIAYQL